MFRAYGLGVFRVFRVFGVFRVFRVFGVFRVFWVFWVFWVLRVQCGSRGWLWGLIWVWPDKNDPKCDMGFDSDTISKKCSKQLKN